MSGVKYNKEENNTDEFSFKTINDFDEHISLSIPNYKFLAAQCKQYAEYFVRDFTNVVDLGCSTGKFLNELPNRDSVGYYGYDIADNLFLKNTKSNLNLIKEDLVTLAENTMNRSPLIDRYPEDISFAISLFTLQFLPPIKRQLVINAISESMTRGGAFISCEKVLSTEPKLQDITNSIYYEFKNESFTGDQILSKERDLRKIMTPQSIEESIRQLSVIGKPNLFWMSYNFVGIIVIKD